MHGHNDFRVGSSPVQSSTARLVSPPAGKRERIGTEKPISWRATALSANKKGLHSGRIRRTDTGKTRESVEIERHIIQLVLCTEEGWTSKDVEGKEKQNIRKAGKRKKKKENTLKQRKYESGPRQKEKCFRLRQQAACRRIFQASSSCLLIALAEA